MTAVKDTVETAYIRELTTLHSAAVHKIAGLRPSRLRTPSIHPITTIAHPVNRAIGMNSTLLQDYYKELLNKT